MIDYKNIGKRIFYLAIPAMVAGCLNVEPWERNFLAKENMVTDPYLLHATFKEHVFFSREGTESAGGLFGGGCGCN